MHLYEIIPLRDFPVFPAITLTVINSFLHVVISKRMVKGKVFDLPTKLEPLFGNHCLQTLGSHISHDLRGIFERGRLCKTHPPYV